MKDLKPWSPSSPRMSHLIKMKRVKTENRRPIKCCLSRAQFTVLWMLFCFCGNFYQVYHISSQYFSFTISTNVQLVVDDILEVPTMTLCFDLPQVVKWHSLSHEERVDILINSGPRMPGQTANIIPGYDVKKENDSDVDRIPRLIMEGMNNFFVRLLITSNLQMFKLSRIFEVTKKYNEITTEAMLFFSFFNDSLHSENTYVQMNVSDFVAAEAMNVSTFLKDTMKCYSMDIKQEHRKLSFYTVMRQAIVPGMLSFYKISNEVINSTKSLNYILTPNGRVMRAGFYSYVPLSPQYSRSFSMTYDTYEAYLLPPPFETRCVEYKKLGLGSRGDCYEACVRSAMLDINGLVPQGVNIHPDETHDLLSLSSLLFNGTTKTMLRKLDVMCDLRCHAKDCISIAHIPRKLTTSRTPNMTVIANIAPQSPTVRASCQQMLTLTQFLTDLVSTFGFWLGISVFGIFRFFRRSGKAISEAYLASPQDSSQDLSKGRAEYVQSKRNASGKACFSHSGSYSGLDKQPVCDYLLVNGTPGQEIKTN